MQAASKAIFGGPANFFPNSDICQRSEFPWDISVTPTKSVRGRGDCISDAWKKSFYWKEKHQLRLREALRERAKVLLPQPQEGHTVCPIKFRTGFLSQLSSIWKKQTQRIVRVVLNEMHSIGE